MDATHLIQRLMLSPAPTKWFRRQMQRMKLASIQPVDDPSVVVVRPYGIHKGLGATQFPQDYTLMHFGGTLRGRRIGAWHPQLMISADPQPVNAPTVFAWRSSPVIHKFSEQWVTDDNDPEEV